MYIDVSEIRRSPGQSFHFDFLEIPKPMEIENDEIHFSEPLKISLDVKNSGNILELTGTVVGDTMLVCGRCLEKFPFHMDADFAEKYCHEAEVPAALEEGQHLDDIHSFAGHKIDLDDLIMESIVLNLPMKSLCSQNCQGLCTVCGTNLNNKKCGCNTETLDPRLAALKDFFKS